MNHMSDGHAFFCTIHDQNGYKKWLNGEPIKMTHMCVSIQNTVIHFRLGILAWNMS